MEDQTQQPVPLPQKPRKKILIAGIVGLAILVALAIAFFITTQVQQKNKEDAERAAAAVTDRFYDVLGNAAKQTNIRVAMYRATYATKADADANKNVGTVQSSVSEVDSNHYRSVFAHNIIRTPKFEAGRCIDGVEYTDFFEDINTRPETLQGILDTLGHLHKLTIPPILSPCPHVGIISGSSPDLAVSRLSDGVFPVTLTAAQSADWVAKMKQANLLAIKDEGMLEQSGRQLHKMSFTSKADDANKQLYTIFRQTAEIDKAIRDQPNMEWQYEFISVNPGNTGGVEGYYLFDDATQLPVYSELRGINADRSIEQNGKTAIRNIARTKQSYAYPKQPSIDLTTPLEFLQ